MDTPDNMIWSWASNNWKIKMIQINEDRLNKSAVTNPNKMSLFSLSSYDMLSSGMSWSINLSCPLIVTVLMIWSAILSNFDELFLIIVVDDRSESSDWSSNFLESCKQVRTPNSKKGLRLCLNGFFND